MSAIFSTPVLVGLIAGLAALPVLIHLINMLRHRRVKWAAMDFLLRSYKKNRNWILLKQMLLLAMRVSALLLLLLMLAHIGCKNSKIAGIFEGQATHHYVVLDDSFSMSDRVGDMTPFDRARKIIGLIAQRAGARENQRFTLLRYSRATGVRSQDSSDLPMDDVADINSEVVDTKLNKLLENRRATIGVSELSVGPLPALNMVRQLVQSREDQTAIVYLVSDFRSKEWENPHEIKSQLEKLEQLEAAIELVNCARVERQNLAIVDMKPDEETRSSGVTFFMNVAVKNFGPGVASNVQVNFRKIFYDRNDEAEGDPLQAGGHPQRLPPEVIDEIKPGEVAWRRAQVDFAKGGRHVVEATLPRDAIDADNRWRTVVELMDGVPVLIVHGRESRRHAYYLASVFDPGEDTVTGIRPVVKSEDFLRDAEPEELDAYHAIYLTDVARPDPRAVSNLEKYVAAGGGVGFFVGPSVDIQYYNNQVYRGGNGLFPLPLDPTAGVAILPEEATQDLPDILPTEHPAFSLYMNERDTFLNQITLDRYLKPPTDWSADDDNSVQVAALLRTRDPLAVERRLGQGKVMAILTTATPDWSDWQGNPTFVITLLKLQAHLAGGRTRDAKLTVGAPIVVTMDEKKFAADVVFVTPGEQVSIVDDDEETAADSRVAIDQKAVPADGGKGQLTATLGGSTSDRRTDQSTNRSGVYEAWLFSKANEIDVRRFALNVDTSESDLALVNPTGLLARLGDLEPSYIVWDQFNPKLPDQEGFSLSRMLLVALICMLTAEQIMAYSISYHPARRNRRAGSDPQPSIRAHASRGGSR